MNLGLNITFDKNHNTYMIVLRLKATKFLRELFANSKVFMWIFMSHLKNLSDGRNVSQKKKGASTSYTHGNSYSKL